MHYFLDTEFTNLPWAAFPTLISIGLDKENGETYYACLDDFERNGISDFVKQNIVPQLPPPAERRSAVIVRRELLEFISPAPLNFWSVFPDEAWMVGLGVPTDRAGEYLTKFGDFDFQLMRRLIGDLYPSTWPTQGRNLNPIIAEVEKADKIPNNECPHNALSDAQQARDIWVIAQARNYGL